MATEITEGEFRKILFQESWRVVKQEFKKLSFYQWLFVVFVTIPLALITAPFYGAGLIGAALIKLHLRLINMMPDSKQPTDESIQV